MLGQKWRERDKKETCYRKEKEKGLSFLSPHMLSVITDTGPDSYMDCPSFTHYGKLKSGTQGKSFRAQSF